MRLSIITINYNGSENTLKLLKSLKEQSDQDFQVIVVDNASERADFNRLESLTRGALVRIVRNDQNLGFSGGNNVGIQQAFRGGSDWVLLLNNDTWVEGGFIASLGPILSAREGIVGLSVAEGNEVVNRGVLEWLRPTLEHIYSQDEDSKGYYINGAAMAISKEAFDKIGGFDENYFLYFEDTDYSVRAKKASVKVSFIKEPEVNHSISATTKKLGSPLLLRYHYRNALYFNWKNGPSHVKLFVWFWSFWIIKKQLFKLMIRYRTEESRAILNGAFDFYRGRMGKI
ncbi:MAG: hypothetical protein A3B91_04435 [Candidatus Yanofskybacteria bacterium RIFCSPHIGHO2_02_FULL_41_29]|uniref:Glycosyltransferase 2-like domain-containing protein n=1 Tax=Candidatus Yanofskybacteria bacterium RIFCSPHIGHO2_01_FULL_41_53 TaxID=1802663 RepID=A0A1F8EJE4_9BACT|nr:MAG: hypothetical protein A2650_03695 [Candidatus Yanofskybacteria bacterium RIFCSPHIGHO2_01_FULL_41_53]OGN11767.1 MAG: hypothetical protein A3B91_04435 [Candidatus Yanofskybacteria bacterium RIFCSPHIGHO2_02_FULL_41_29]OGN18858.1 MAG: hypothetical protein A3F48_02020 [Candidatus Yanofskybacteria bacterium RIFCSPHIGHO2_12_FULL_41_9]OGN22921.1 MAG: hypothetical protein A2916_00890 [Candidatus Yanofskybacteria bacterium RIFCSPLOWO2_01_FULL_41_67]OGN30198.1 MAG: hypothetical protein A3H54_00945 